MHVLINSFLSIIALFLSIWLISKLNFFNKIKNYKLYLKDLFVIIKNNESDFEKQKKLLNLSIKIMKINFFILLDFLIMLMPFFFIIILDIFLKFNYINFIFTIWFLILLVIFLPLGKLTINYFNKTEK